MIIRIQHTLRPLEGQTVSAREDSAETRMRFKVALEALITHLPTRRSVADDKLSRLGRPRSCQQPKGALLDYLKVVRANHSAARRTRLSCGLERRLRRLQQTEIEHRIAVPVKRIRASCRHLPLPPQLG